MSDAPSPTKRPLLHTLILLANCTIAFIVFNLLIWAGYAIKGAFDPFSNAVESNYRIPIEKYYTGMTSSEIDRLINETYQPFEYAPYVEFRESPRSGTYVNVSKDGFRVSSRQSEWPPKADKPIIFVFGGSTVFGYGVKDDDTVVSVLSEKLRQDPKYADAQVYNFGRGFYWSAQEYMLFNTLLMSNFKPDVAIFIDGLNEFSILDQTPQYSAVLRNAFRRETDQTGAIQRQLLNLARDVRGLLSTLPMAQLARSIRGKIKAEYSPEAFQPEDPKAVQKSIDSYLLNKSLIEKAAAQNQIQTLFVWQPVPTFRYPPHLYAEFAAQNGFGVHSQSHYGYPIMAKRNEPSRDPNFVWCADVQQRARKPLYVDLVHYNRAGGELLADCVLAALLKR